MKHAAFLLALLFATATTALAQVTITNNSLGIGTTMPSFQLEVSEIGSSAGDVRVNDNLVVMGSLDLFPGTLFSSQPSIFLNDNLRVSGWVHLLPPGAELGSDSELIVGLQDDTEDTYVRFDVEPNMPPAADCAAEDHTGRSRVGRDPAGLYICLDGAWLFVAASVAP